jgi:hypothetical protein
LEVSSGNSIEVYEQQLSAARAAFGAHPGVSGLLSPEMNARVLHLFLIHFSALGVHMTEPVEYWIRTAGERCDALGYRDLGRALQAHAKGEANHHLLMIEDTRNLVAQWNSRYGEVLMPERFLEMPGTPGAIRYRKLHQDVIGGNAPYAQLAIEYEIENLSVSYGPSLIRQCMTLLPQETLGGLSFLQEHVELDVGHTQFNRRQLGEFVSAHPEATADLVAAGKDALAAYADFVADCLRLAVSLNELS